MLGAHEPITQSAQTKRIISTKQHHYQYNKASSVPIAAFYPLAFSCQIAALCLATHCMLLC